MISKKKILVIAALSALTLFSISLNACNGSTDDGATATSSVAVTEKPDYYGEVTKLGKYDGVAIDVTPDRLLIATDEEVDSFIEKRLSANPVITEITDRGAQKGDKVNMDCTTVIKGDEANPNIETGQNLVIGEGKSIQGFEDQLLGKKTGETVTFDLAFPDDYSQEEFAGKKATFTVKINSITLETPAVLNDDWVKSSTDGQFDKVEDMKKYIQEELTKQNERIEQQQRQYDALNKVIDSSKYKLNDDAVEYEYSKKLANVQAAADGYGLDLDTYAVLYNTDGKGLKKLLRTQAENTVKQQLTIDAIKTTENIEAKDKDYDDYVVFAGYQDKAEMITEIGEEAADTSVLNYAVLQYVVEHSVKTEVEPTTEAQPE